MKILNRGYWVAKHFYWQSLVHYFVNCVRFRSMTFFSVANPAIDLGGMLTDRKTDFYELAPQDKIPATTIVTTLDAATIFMQANNLTFPIIIKPNVGYKGMDVKKIDRIDELESFFNRTGLQKKEWIIQEFVSAEKEFSVLVYKHPRSQKYGISSFVEKKYPTVSADGKRTYRQLIDEYKNPFLKKEYARKKYATLLDTIPQKDKKIILDHIGNYSRGAKFYSLNEQITSDMEAIFYDQYKNQDGLNFFRIDCKADSVENCQKGNYKILEINGMKAEPLHIYDPKYSFLHNTIELVKHWRHIKDVTREQKGVLKNTPSFAEGLKSFKTLKNQFK